MIIAPVRQSSPDARLQAFRKCCAKEPTRVEIIEWLSAVAMTIVGAYILFNPAAIAVSHMRMLTDTLPGFSIAALCIAVGCLRLAFAGQRQISGGIFQARSILGVLSAVIWVEMAYAFAVRFAGQTLPPGFFMMVIFQVGGDLWMVARLRTHVRQLRQKGMIP